MLPTAGVPFLAHLLSRIRAAGVRRVVLGTSYMAETFAKEFGDGEALGLELVYVVEDEPLGTGGGIRNVAKHLTSDTCSSSTATCCAAPIWARSSAPTATTAADVTLHLVRVPDPRAFGCVPTDASGQVLEFLEKTEDPPTDQINAGCYVFRRSVIDSIPDGRPVSVERETFPGLLEAGARVSGHVDNAYWRDMGTPADLVHGSADLVRGVAPSAALPGPTGEALVLDGAKIAADALVFGGSTVGRGVTIGAGARVDGSMLFDGAVVAPGAVVEQSIVGAAAHDRGGRHAARHGGRRPRGRRRALRAAARDAGVARHRAAAARGALLPGCLSPVSGNSGHSDCFHSREWRPDLRRSTSAGVLAPVRRGRGDPTFRTTEGGAIWRTATTPDGPATTVVHRRADGTVVMRAWGPGAAWSLDGLPALLGRGRPPGGVRRPPPARRRRPPTHGRACASAPPAGCGTSSSRRCWSRRSPARRRGGRGGSSCAATATPPPDPRPTACACRRRPRRSARCPTGSGTRRASTTPGGARSWPPRSVAHRLERAVELGGGEGRALLRLVPGIGVWTAAEVAQRAWGDVDAVSFGDFHIPTVVGWALAGRPLDDVGLAEVLAPYAPQRQRAVRYVESSGFRRPRFGPRFSPRDYRAM